MLNWVFLISLNWVLCTRQKEREPHDWALGNAEMEGSFAWSEAINCNHSSSLWKIWAEPRQSRVSDNKSMFKSAKKSVIVYGNWYWMQQIGEAVSKCRFCHCLERSGVHSLISEVQCLCCGEVYLLIGRGWIVFFFLNKVMILLTENISFSDIEQKWQIWDRVVNYEVIWIERRFLSCTLTTPVFKLQLEEKITGARESSITEVT